MSRLTVLAGAGRRQPRVLGVDSTHVYNYKDPEKRNVLGLLGLKRCAQSDGQYRAMVGRVIASTRRWE